MELPKTLGRYRIGRQIAAGGMGVVYEAQDTGLGRRLAIKTLRDDFTRDQAQALERFRQEALATASLNHPHIIQVTDFSVGPPTYLVMELLHGESLRERLRRTRCLVPNEAVAVAVQVLSALEAAHEAGIVHRDIKPENVFLVATAATPVYVKVLDFGIAKLLDHAGPPLTRSNEIIGSLAYMAPEQISASEISERSDVYAVGVLLYELLAGRTPYRASNAAALLSAILKGARPEPIAGIAPSLAAAIRRAMATLPSERFASAREMRIALQAVATPADDLATEMIVDPRGALEWDSPSTEKLVVAAGSQTTPSTLRLAHTPRGAERFRPRAVQKPARPIGFLMVLLVVCILAALAVAVACFTIWYLRRHGGR